MHGAYVFVKEGVNKNISVERSMCGVEEWGGQGSSLSHPGQRGYTYPHIQPPQPSLTHLPMNVPQGTQYITFPYDFTL